MVCSKVLGGVKVGGSVHEEEEKLRWYCEERQFDNAVKTHNRGNKYIDPHELLNVNLEHAMAAGNTLWDDDGAQHFEHRKGDKCRGDYILYRWYVQYIQRRDLSIEGPDWKKM